MRAASIRRHGEFSVNDATDQIVLTADARARRRAGLTTSTGRNLLLDLPHATFLHDGDALLTDNDQLVLIKAAPEPVLDITAPPELLARLAWHVGNRHVQVQFLPTGFRLHRDHVLAAMLANLGATVTEKDEPFDPEPGAYAHHG